MDQTAPTQNCMQELLGSHAFLLNLETELGKERDSLVKQCTRKTIVAASYPILEHYYNLTTQYFNEQSKFRTQLETVHQQQQQQQQQQQGISLMMGNNASNASDGSRKIAPSSNGNYSYSDGVQQQPLCGGDSDDTKQREQETQTVPPSDLYDESETKVEPRSHQSYVSPRVPPQRRKPPVKSATSTTLSLNTMNMGRSMHLHSNNGAGHGNLNGSGGAELLRTVTPPHKPPKKPLTSLSPHALSPHALSSPPIPLPPVHRQSQPPPQARAPSQSTLQQQQQQQQQQHLEALKERRKLTVQRQKYQYEGRGFEIWRRNLQRPIYTAGSLRVARHFNGDERLARRFLVKAGFRPEHVEQVSFILKKENGQTPRIERHKEIPAKKIDFTVVRVRAALPFIYDCIDRVERDPDCGVDVVKLQMNRPPKAKKSAAQPSAKVRVSNFDILDKNTHHQITRLFLQFGDLEHDIVISADRKKDPFAVVQFRSASDAAYCLKTHTDKKSTLFFPPRDASGKDGGDRDTAAAMDNDVANNRQRFLNRKLHLEFVLDAAQGNRAAANRGRRGGRGVGRGGRR